jgi:hypothetical protein
VRRLLPPALVALAAVAVFAVTVSYQFAYDDHSVIVENRLVHHLANWPQILTSPWWPRGLYRPFTSLTLAANWTLDPGDPAGFHGVNVLLHALAAALVWVLGTRVMGAPGGVAAGLLFAVHPVHVEAVANVVGRAEVLATVFALAAALAYLRYGEWAGDPGDGSRRRGLAAAGTLAATVLALASKESAFALPGVLLAADWAAAAAAGVSLRERLARTWPLWAGVLLVAVGWLFVRAAVVGGLAGDLPAPGLARTTMGERIAIMLPVVPEYLRLLLVPARLSVEYSPDFLPVSTRFGLRALGGLLALACCVAAAVALRRRAPAASAGLLWAGTALFVVGNVLVPSGVLLAERTLYLASAGVCLALGALWALLHRAHSAPAVVLLALVLGLGAARSYTRAGIWRDDSTLFPQLVADAPGSYRADWVGGMLAYLGGDSTRGERLMRQGLETYGGNGAMWSDFAVVMERQRRWNEAAEYFWRSFQADSGRASDAARAVANLIQNRQLDSARVLLERAQRVHPESPDLAISESHLALARGDAARSVVLRRRVAGQNPGDWRYWHLTAEAALRARECAALREALQRMEALRAGVPRAAVLADSARALCPAPPPLSP